MPDDSDVWQRLVARRVRAWIETSRAAALEHLKGLTQLHTLDLCDTQVTDAGLEHLKGLRQLQWLDLERTQVTDAWLECLNGLRQLRRLDLCETQVTEAGVEELQGALLKTSIYPMIRRQN